ncbi:hypothetical protein FRB99_002577 [Tulasnella sp. 403]|nr:hypothetical protein FRB99_002577 [Tulasnella sp. 403]
MPETNNRSTSRGRDFATTGRGGAGNLVRGESASRARITRVEDGDERGRDVAPREDGRVTHAGRGGQGNIRSPSRDPAKDAADRAFEEDVLRKSREHREAFGVSHGRGGTGNIDKSRSRSRDPAGFGSGRGGAGNIHDHEHHRPEAELERLDEEERAIHEAKHHHHLFSHGRGGKGNLTQDEANLPHPTTVAAQAGSHIGGRGGQGNVAA